MAATLSTLTGWLLFAALVLTAGTVTSRWLVLPRAALEGAPPQSWLLDSTARVGRVAAGALPFAMILVFVRQIAEFRDPFAPLAEDVELLLGTSWGRAWMWGLFGSLLAVAGFWLAVSGRRWGWWIATAAAVALASFPGLTGHAAAGEGGRRWLALTGDTLHVLAAGGWIGGLTVVLLLDRSWRRTSLDAESNGVLPALVPAFSPVAVAGVATLMATGLLASWIHLPTFGALWETDYGRLLALKVGLVLVVLGLGALNWKKITPLLSGPEGATAMRRAAALELAIATAVLLATAILVRTSPMGS